MKKSLLLISLIAFVLFFSEIAIGQTMPSDSDKNVASKIPYAYWINFGYGYSSLGGNSGGLYANAQVTNSLVLTGGIQAEDSQKGFFLGPGQNTSINTGNIFAGWVVKQNGSLFLFSAGLSYVDQQNTTDYGLFSTIPTKTVDQRGFGVPLMAQGYVVLCQICGLGLNLYANINTLQSTAGCTVNLAFGRMRTH